MIRKLNTISLLVMAAFLLAGSVSEAKMIYVDDDANGLNDGSSWANAYSYLQDALADANSAEKPVEIRVAQGIYKPDQGANQILGDREATFQLINGVAIMGGYAGFNESDPNARDIGAYETILSGDLACDDANITNPFQPGSQKGWGDNSYHVITGSGTDRMAILDGFTITAGNDDSLVGLIDPNPVGHGGGMLNQRGSPTIVNCTFTYNLANKCGGGMYNDQSNPMLTNCTFSENSADGGGGMYNYGSSPELTNCTFSENLADFGGGICNSTSDTILTNCTFSGNKARYGGGIVNSTYSYPTMTNCTFRRNEADRDGGGMVNSAYGFPTMTNCTFSRNKARCGGGMNNYSYSNPTVTNCIFSGNSAEEGGGIFFTFGAHMRMSNCTFTGNFAKSGNALASESSKSTGLIELTNCILWDGDNTISDPDPYALKSSITYSNVQGGWPGEGNIDAVPCFANPGRWVNENDPNQIVEPNDPNAVWINGDYHLKSQAGRWDSSSASWVKDDVTSPCIDAGDPSSPVGFEPFPNGGVINMGAYGGTAEASKSYFGEPVCETIIAGDINGDCKVDFGDFALIAAHWLEDR